MPPGPGHRQCTPYLWPGPGGMPLVLRLSEVLGCTDFAAITLRWPRLRVVACAGTALVIRRLLLGCKQIALVLGFCSRSSTVWMLVFLNALPQVLKVFSPFPFGFGLTTIRWRDMRFAAFGGPI